MKIKPLEDRILLKELQKTGENIFRRDLQKHKKLFYGKVVSVGDGRITEKGKNIPMSVKVGDIVLYPYYAGIYVEIDKKEYLLIRGEEALAIQTKEEK